MATGDYIVRRNTSNTDTIPNAGSTLTTLWDTAVAANGSGITYSAGTYTLVDNNAYFLIIYSDQYGCSAQTDKERINDKTYLTINGSATDYGRSSGYIRKNNSGSSEFINSGAAIIKTTLSNTTVEITHERVDNTTGVGEEPDRIPDRSGVTIIQLDSSWDYGRYRRTTTQSVSAATNGTVDPAFTTTDEEDASFSISGGTDLTVSGDGLYLSTYTIPIVGGSDRCEFQGAIFDDSASAYYPGSMSQTYIRNYDGEDDGCLSNVCLMELEDGDVVVPKVITREVAGSPLIQAGSSWQIVKLPAAAKACIVAATTGDYNTSATNFAWDTNPYIDSDVFTHSAGNANIDVDEDGDFLALAGHASTSAAAATRAVPASGFRVNTTDQEIAGGSSYCRNVGTAHFPAYSFGGLLTGLSTNDSVYVRDDRIGTNTGTVTNGVGGFSLISLNSLFPASTTLQSWNGTNWSSLSEYNDTTIANIQSWNGIDI